MNLTKKYMIEALNIINSQNYQNTPKNREFLQTIAKQLNDLLIKDSFQEVFSLVVAMRVQMRIFNTYIPAPKLKAGSLYLKISPTNRIEPNVFFKLKTISSVTNLQMMQ